MRRRFLYIILALAILASQTSIGFADESEGDMKTFCPYMSTLSFNTMLKSMLDLSDSQAALVQVTSDGRKDGNLVYSDPLQNTIFIFGGADNEFDTATTAYIYCSLKDSSTLKNIPMIIWAAIIEMSYNGDIKETGSTFLEWVNEVRSDGDTYTSPYFTALYTEKPYDQCTLLLSRR